MDGIFLKTSLQRSFRLLGFVLVMMSLAIASPAAERGPGASSQAPAQGLVVTANFTDQEVDPSFVITLNLSRPLQAAEGRVAVLIGQTDFTNLFTPTGNSLSYLPRIVPLPAGESPIRIFLVSPSNEWRELTQLTLRVRTAPPADAAPGQSTGQAQNICSRSRATGSGAKIRLHAFSDVGDEIANGRAPLPCLQSSGKADLHRPDAPGKSEIRDTIADGSRTRRNSTSSDRVFRKKLCGLAPWAQPRRR